jgi:hypothetical protein
VLLYNCRITAPYQPHIPPLELELNVIELSHQSHLFTLRYCLPSYLPNAFVATGFSRAYPGKRNAASRVLSTSEGKASGFVRSIEDDLCPKYRERYLRAMQDRSVGGISQTDLSVVD